MPLDQEGAGARGGGGGGRAGGTAEGPGGRAESGGLVGSAGQGSVPRGAEPEGDSGDGAAKLDGWQQQQQQQQQQLVQTVCARALQQRWGRSPYWQDRGQESGQEGGKGSRGEEGQAPRVPAACFLGSAVHVLITEHVARLNVGLLAPWGPGAGGGPEGGEGAGEEQEGQGGGDHGKAWECPFGAVGCDVESLH